MTGWRRTAGWRARRVPARKVFDDDHWRATRGAGVSVRVFMRHHVRIFCRGWRSLGTQQFTRFQHCVDALMIGEQPVVSNAVEAARMDMEEKATDELVIRERHGFIAFTRWSSLILPLEGDAVLSAFDEATVGDGDAVGIAR